MKKIKITEKQAELLGLTKINENEDGLKSVSVALGNVVIRVVISGESVPKFKDRIIQLISRHDKEARVGFFEQTGKIVGNIKEVKLDSIRRDIQALDSNIIVEKKPIVKSLKEDVKHIYKITKEQYNRIFATKLINETDLVKGGLSRVDTEVKKTLPVSSDVMNLKMEDSEGSNFDIKKPNTSLSNSANGKFGQPMTEDENKDKLSKESKELIKYLYRKSETLSPFWEENGVSYDELCNHLTAKNFIVSKNGKYELSKTLGSNPQEALTAFENELKTLLKPTNSKIEQPEEESVEVDESNYPAGSNDDSDATWNKVDQDSSKPDLPKESKLEPIAFNNEICLFQGPDGLYVFYYDNIDKKDFMEYASVPRTYVGKDEDGQPEYDYDFDSVDIDETVVAHYVNDNLATLSKGEGLEAYEEGVNLVKLDEPLKKELAYLYDKDKNMIKVLGPIEESEADFDIAMDSFKNNLAQAATPSDKPKIPQSKIVAKLAELKAKELERRKAEQNSIDTQSGVDEMTSAASSGAFTAPMSSDVIKKDTLNVPIVGEGKLGDGYTHFAIDKLTNKIVNGWDYNGLENDEIKHWVKLDLKDQFPDRKANEFKVLNRTSLIKNGIDPTNSENWYKIDLTEITTVGSVGGQYDTPGFANIGKNGEFKNGPKTKAEKTTQWAGGSFVKQPDCSKPNNNKAAQNGGCNSGASSLKMKTSGGSINAPSLGENKIYEEISKKTGKTIEEVKRIIESKNNKA